jgi:hypothetical protein
MILREKAAPLLVVAKLHHTIVMSRPPMLDGLLAWSCATRERLVAFGDPESMMSIEVPLAREPGGRFHLCSSGFTRVFAHDARYKNRQAPAYEYARLGARGIGRVQINVGEDKSYRVPYVAHLAREIRWWALGDRELVSDLLSEVHYLGKFRGAGHGRVILPWSVEPCEPWGPDFPVAKGGAACRPLPLDYLGLTGEQHTAYSTLTYPYWDHAVEELVAVPSPLTNHRMAA